MRFGRAGSALLWLALVSVSVARADEPSRAQLAAAEAAFDEGKRLASKGRDEEAAGKFEESQRLAPASGTLLNLADCYERLGRTATAWGTFRAASAAARAKGNRGREEEARARAAALEPRLSKIRIVVDDGSRVSGLQIRSADLEVGESMWGVPMPVDPGTITVTATAPSHTAWSQQVSVPPSPGVVDVAVPKLEDARPPAGPAPVRPPPPTGLGVQRVTALVVVGVGAVALGFGTAFGIDAIGKKDRSNNEGGCRKDLCPPDGLELRNQAVTEGYLSTGLFIAAGAALATGGVLWLTAPHQTSVAIGAAPDRVGMRLGGTW